MRILKTLAFCSATLFASSAFAAPLTASDILGQFNAVVKTTFSTSHDVEGRMVADHITKGATFNLKPGSSTSDYAAVNANVIDSFGGANVNNGGSVNYQVSNGTKFSFNGGGAAVKASTAFAMSDFTTPLDNLATQLAGMSANSVVDAKDNNNFKFDISGAVSVSGTAVFDLKGADTAALFNSSNITFNGSANTIIINVYSDSGILAQSGGSNFNGSDFLNTHVIWNFVDATSLSFKYWHGTVLAGNAAVSNISPIEGTLYANSFSGEGELHNFAFAGTLPTTVSPVPEPATYLMLLAGLGAIVVLARRKARQA